MAQYDPYIRYIKPCADPWVDYKMAQYYPYIYIHTGCLVGGFNPSEKYESQLGL
jgi:hypothetical protein